MSTEATDTLATPSSRPEAPARYEAVKNSSASAPPVQPRATPTRDENRTKMRAIGQGMKDGTVQDHRDVRDTLSRLQQPQGSTTPSSSATPPARSPVTPAKNEQAAPATQNPQADAEQKSKLAQAKRVLARDGWMPTDFDGRDAADLIARADQRSRVHAEVDRAFGELSKLKQQAPRNADGTFATKPPEAAANPATPATPAAAVDAAQPPALNSEVAALIAAAKDKVGEPAAQLLTQIATVLSNQVNQRASTSDFLAFEMLLRDGQQMFAELYPDQAAADPAGFGEVQKDFEVLLRTGRYESGQTRKAWADALHMAFGPPNTASVAMRDALSRQASAVRGKVDPGAHQAAAVPANATDTRKDKLRLAGQLMAQHRNASMADLTRMLNG